MNYFSVKYILVFITLFISSFIFKKNDIEFIHPFFVSVTEIQQNKDDKILEVSCKIFTDDFEKTLRQNYHQHIDLLNFADKKNMEAPVLDYVKKHLHIVVDEKILQLQFVGYEQDEEATWCYFQVNNVEPVKNIKITDTLLYDYKKEQINLLHVTVNGIRKSDKLNNPESTIVFDF